MRFSIKKLFLSFISLFIIDSFFLTAQVFAQSTNNSASDNISVSENSQLNSSELNAANSEANISLNFNQDNGNGQRRSAFSGIGVFIRMILVLALIIFIIWFVFRMMKKSTAAENNEDPFLRKCSSISLGSGKSVQIVSLIDKAYVLGVSEQSVNLISVIEDEQLINALNVYADKTISVEKPKSFEELLGIFTGEKVVSKTNENSTGKKFGFFGFNTAANKKVTLDKETSALINSLKNKRLHSDSVESQENDGDEN